MCKRKLTIEQEHEIKEKYESGYLIPDLMKMYGFKTKKNISSLFR